jgi:GNAT superfamily N-acetyltransferase
MIRRALHTDWPAIVRLLDQLDYPDTGKFLESRLVQMLDDPAEILLVWEDNTKIFGFLSLHFIPQIALEGDFARISYFSIDESARGQGLGARLEQHATQLARERGCELIEVHCHTRREKAHAFYFRQGYEESPKYLIKRLK